MVEQRSLPVVSEQHRSAKLTKLWAKKTSLLVVCVDLTSYVGSMQNFVSLVASV